MEFKGPITLRPEMSKSRESFTGARERNLGFLVLAVGSHPYGDT